MTEAEAAHAAHDILQVLAECHRQGICYADVKPANFLLTRPYRRSGQGEDSRLLELRTTDFGCSQRIQEVCILFILSCELRKSGVCPNVKTARLATAHAGQALDGISGCCRAAS